METKHNYSILASISRKDMWKMKLEETTVKKSEGNQQKENELEETYTNQAKRIVKSTRSNHMHRNLIAYRGIPLLSNRYNLLR